MIAHAVSVIVIQATAAEGMLDVNPERAREPLASVQESGRQALGELRRLLAVLRPDVAPYAALSPQPRLRDLDALAVPLREAGLTVDVHIEGAVLDIPPGVDLAAYRIVQEALTNVLKHADARVADVAVRCLSERIDIEVIDDGTGAISPANGTHGLIGMRERAAAYAGELYFGHHSGGGHVVERPQSAEQPVIRTLIADDQALVRDGFALILESQPDIEVVGQAADGREAVQACGELRPDVVLMDVRMPVMDGIEATRQITAQGASRVLMLTTFDLDTYIYSAFLAGASGFLVEHVCRSELIHAVGTVAQGETLVAPAITRRLVEEFVRRPHPGQSPAQLDVLTSREVEILALIGRGYSNSEIAAELFLAEATVKTHVSRIFAKLNLRDRVQAACSRLRDRRSSTGNLSWAQLRWLIGVDRRQPCRA